MHRRAASRGKYHWWGGGGPAALGPARATGHALGHDSRHRKSCSLWCGRLARENPFRSTSRGRQPGRVPDARARLLPPVNALPVGSASPVAAVAAGRAAGAPGWWLSATTHRAHPTGPRAAREPDHRGAVAGLALTSLLRPGCRARPAGSGGTRLSPRDVSRDRSAAVARRRPHPQTRPRDLGVPKRPAPAQRHVGPLPRSFPAPPDSSLAPVVSRPRARSGSAARLWIGSGRRANPPHRHCRSWPGLGREGGRCPPVRAGIAALAQHATAS